MDTTPVGGCYKLPPINAAPPSGDVDENGDLLDAERDRYARIVGAIGPFIADDVGRGSQAALVVHLLARGAES